MPELIQVSFSILKQQIPHIDERWHTEDSLCLYPALQLSELSSYGCVKSLEEQEARIPKLSFPLAHT